MATDDALILLRSIDASLKQLVKQSLQAQPKAIASDRELDSQYGNPVVKFNPRDWTGDSFKGARFAQCPAPFLELLAETFDYFAQKAEETDKRANNGKPVAPYNRSDAARARGWAKRVREGHVYTAAAPTSGGNGTSAPEWGTENDREEQDGWS